MIRLVLLVVLVSSAFLVLQRFYFAELTGWFFLNSRLFVSKSLLYLLIEFSNAVSALVIFCSSVSSGFPTRLSRCSFRASLWLLVLLASASSFMEVLPTLRFSPLAIFDLSPLFGFQCDNFINNAH
jgi:hypothetical protein